MTVGARSNSKAGLWQKKLGSGKKSLVPAQKSLAPGSSGAATLQNEANKSEKMYHFILEILYTQ